MHGHSRRKVRSAALHLSRGAIVGMTATVVDVVVLVFLVRAGVAANVASVPALATGILIQFIGSKLFTFEDRSRAWAKQGFWFFVVEAAAFALNLALFDVALRVVHLPLPVLRLASTSVVYFAFSLPLWSLVFKGAPERERGSIVAIRRLLTPRPSLGRKKS